MVEPVQHPAFPLPSSLNAKIWRYLTPAKFEWLVTESRLFMPSAANLGDPLEGTQPLGDVNYWQSLLDGASSDEERRTIEHNRQLISRFAVAFRTRYYVSCWHISETINAAMWAQYAGSTDSVAIRTDVGKLKAALPLYVEVGIVRYVDFATDRMPTLNMLEFITHKSKLFEAEQELRAVALHPLVAGPDQEHFRSHHFEFESAPALRVFAPPICLAELIEAVYVHPQASDAFFERIGGLCEGHALPSPERAPM